MSNDNAALTGEEMNRLYSILRSELYGLSVQNIRNTVAAAGFDVTRIPATSEARTGLGSRSEVMPVIDRLFGEMRPEVKINALIILAEKLTSNNLEEAANVQEILGKHGFQFMNNSFVPIGILDARERQYLPSEAAFNLEKAMERLGNGDFTGAISSATGAVDALTRDIYERDSLGNLNEGFVSKVQKVLNHLNVFQEMENDLVAQGLQVSDAKRVVEEMRNATHHAANILQIYRRDPGDAHGAKPATRKTAYDAIKWASAICGLLEGKI